MNSMIVLVFSAIFVGANAQARYYWRDYNGSIGCDTVQVGKEGGKEYYIAQGLASGYQYYSNLYGLLPAKIERGDTVIYPVIGKGVAVRDGIRLLCSSSPKSFYWLSTSRDTLDKDLANYYPVYGGLEARIDRKYRSQVFIGRSDNCVGKIPAESRELYCSYGAGPEKRFDVYQILVYKSEYC